MRQQLPGALRSRVGRNGLPHRVVLGEGHLVVVAVDGRGRAVDEGVDVELLRNLQHRLGPAHVRLLVGHRRLDRRADARPRREVHDRVHVPSVQGLQDRVRVADVRLDERERLSGEIINPLLLDRAGIEGIEVVYGRDTVAVVQ